MSELYTEAQRAFQKQFDTERLATTIEERIVDDRINAKWRDFIQARDMVFVASVDARGRPACSYKGGAPGFVRVVDESCLAFPLYDGNGMFITAGNLAETAWIGLLFIDFESPQRVRVNGEARVSAEDPLLAAYPEAKLIVRVDVREVYVNCSRYVHRYRRVEASPFVPRADAVTPVPSWKMLDYVEPLLPQADRDEIARRKAAGLPLPEPDGTRGREP